MSTKSGDSPSKIGRSFKIELKISKTCTLSPPTTDHFNGLQRDSTGDGAGHNTSISVEISHESNDNMMRTLGEIVTSIVEAIDTGISASQRRDSPSPGEHGSGGEIAPSAAASGDSSQLQGPDFVPESPQSAGEMEGVGIYFKKVYAVKVLEVRQDDPKRTYLINGWIGRDDLDDCNLANSLSPKHRPSTDADGLESVGVDAADPQKSLKRERTGQITSQNKAHRIGKNYGS